MTTLFVKHLTVIDFSFLDPIRGVVGESLIVDIALSGPLNHEGMVLDFSELCAKENPNFNVNKFHEACGYVVPNFSSR